MFNPVGSKATVCAFTYKPNLIITGHESGKVALFDVVTGTEILNNERAHGDQVTDLQLSTDRTYFITSSKDKAARVSSSHESRFPTAYALEQLHDTKSLRVLKTFTTETPLNSAALTPDKPYVCFSSVFASVLGSSLSRFLLEEARKLCK